MNERHAFAACCSESKSKEKVNCTCEDGIVTTSILKDSL